MILGVGVVICIWAGLTAWVANTARARGRSIVGWSLGAAIAGALGFGAGLQLMARAVDHDVASSAILYAALAPLAFMAIVMTVIAVVLGREPVTVKVRGAWPVHFRDRGAGTLHVTDGRVRLAWSGGERVVELAALGRVEADGECVRIALDGEELVMLPMGRPDSRDGRIQQSRQIERQLRAA